MQDIHSIGGGARIFGGGGGDRRLRPHQHSSNNHQALKCPRCDSLNTKFCYYNNYNLSQPRHFCKSCRRYWTRGGVLRNVPVGGGCRKTKRSSKPKLENKDQNCKSNSHSSSESSSLTAAVAAPESKSAVTNPNLEPPVEEQQGGIFSEMGSFTSLITSSNDPLLYGLNHGDDGLLDQTVQAEFRSSNGGFGSLDQGMFDLPSTVDQTYWNHTQWADQDHPNLYLP